jgi:hypothetical protein
MSKVKNSFKDLEVQDLKTIGEPPKRIHSNIRSNIVFIRAIGDLVSLYGPQFFTYFASSFGSRESMDKNKKYPNL